MKKGLKFSDCTGKHLDMKMPFSVYIKNEVRLDMSMIDLMMRHFNNLLVSDLKTIHSSVEGVSDVVMHL